MFYKKFILITLFIFCLFPFRMQAENTQPIKILIVPGHDNESPGAEYGNLKEADMNLALATQIYNLLKKDKRFSVEITRDSKGYTKKFADYFKNEEKNILSFKEKAKKNMKEKISDGSFTKVSGVSHNPVSADTSLILYGINKWANENKMDAVVHVHFNDVPRKTKWEKGIPKGFAIYTPEDQMANSIESMSLAKNIFIQLKKKYLISTLPEEKGGLVKEQKLIALGASGTLDTGVRSVLIEYGYIYRFGNSVLRYNSYKTMADLTVKGIIKNFTSL